MPLLELERENIVASELENRFRQWEYIDRILQIRDTERLENLVRIDARQFKNVDPEAIEEGLKFMNASHEDQTRDLTGDPYTIHPLQIALIYMTIMPPEKVTSDTINICLNHDVLEDNTTITPPRLARDLNATVAIGVDGMSHTINGGQRLNRKDYIDRVFIFDSLDPSLTLPAIKSIDTFVNGNDPVRAGGLKNPFDTRYNFFFWQKLVNKKINEMDEFGQRLDQRYDPIRQFLSEAMVYTRMSKERDFTMSKFKKPLSMLRNG